MAQVVSGRDPEGLLIGAVEEDESGVGILHEDGVGDGIRRSQEHVDVPARELSSLQSLPHEAGQPFLSGLGHVMILVGSSSVFRKTASSARVAVRSRSARVSGRGVSSR
jgi:hypothetical protein